MNVDYQDRWVVINQVPTHILSWGSHTDEDLSGLEELFLCISGNPGITRFYKSFLSSLYKKINVPIWMISHAGHEIPPSETNLKVPKIKLKENECFFNLQGQIDHKIKLIESLVPPHVQLNLIGHSLGARVIVDILAQNADLKARIKNCYLLFPTLEHIGNTPNADFLIPFFTYFSPAILLLANIFTIIPRSIRYWMIKFTLLIVKREKADSESIEAVVDLVNPNVLRHAFLLFFDEVEKIKDLDIETLNENSTKLQLYFGATDKWCPVAFYNNVKEKCPSVKAKLCDENIQHAFVLSSSERMADKITSWYTKSEEK